MEEVETRKQGSNRTYCFDFMHFFHFSIRAHHCCPLQTLPFFLYKINTFPLHQSKTSFIHFQKKIMTLTLRSSISFINNHKETKLLKTYDDISSTVISFAKYKPCFRLRAKNSMQQEVSQSHSHINEKWEKVHAPSSVVVHNHEDSKRVPVFVMLPLDTVTMGGNLNKPRAMNASLMALKSAGVEGVMVDVWWGLVEKDGPLKYNWEAYAELVRMVQMHGLKLQVVMSFHQCGGNVGDSCRYDISNKF